MGGFGITLLQHNAFVSIQCPTRNPLYLRTANIVGACGRAAADPRTWQPATVRDAALRNTVLRDCRLYLHRITSTVIIWALPFDNQDQTSNHDDEQVAALAVSVLEHLLQVR